MKNKLRCAMVLMLVLLLCLSPLAFAENDDRGTVSTTAKHYGKDVVVGFDTTGYASAIDTDYKYAMAELEKEFPAQLTVYFGGTVWYETDENGASVVLRAAHESEQRLDVAWECAEDYNDDLDVFHFVPALPDYKLADGLELPVITVNILGTLEAPAMAPLPPDPIESIPILGASRPGMLMAASTPSSYTPDYNIDLPPIRDQNPYGTCWAFATLGAIEADMIHDGVADSSVDLSELHLAYFTLHDFYDEKGCNAGDTISLNSYTGSYLEVGLNSYFASTRLSSMIGPVREAEVPYSQNYAYVPSPSAGRAGDLQLTTMVEINANDREAIKAAIQAHGAVSASYFAYNTQTNEYYDAVNNSYYCPIDRTHNHAIMLVGWDDDFASSRFRSAPPGNGAWLVRNSWGVDRENYFGYFWISYYDCSLTTATYYDNSGQISSQKPNTVYAFDVQEQRYDHCYNYANNLTTINLIYNSSTKDITQDFRVDAGEEVSAVGLFINNALTDVNLTLTAGGKTVTQSAGFKFPGYYLVELGTPLTVTASGNVRLSIHYSTSDGVSIPLENASGYFSGVYLTSTCGSPKPVYPGYDGRFLLFTNDDIPVTETLFPDAAFRGYVLQQIDTDGSGYLSKAEIEAVTEIDLAGSAENPGAVTSLQGIETFAALKTLDVSHNALETLELGENTALRWLDCSGCALTELDVSENTALAALHCDGNALETLDLRVRTGEEDSAEDGDGTSVSPNEKLKILSCDANALSALDLSQTPALTKLSCKDNAFRSLDLNACPALKTLVTEAMGADGHYLDEKTQNELVCDESVLLLTAPVTSEGLTIDAERFPDAAFRARVKANCDVNADEILCPAEIAAVKWLDLSGQEIASLKGMEVFTALEVLDCSGNALSRLDVGSNDALRKLSCQQNPLKALNISFNPNLLKLIGGEPTAADGVIRYVGSDGSMGLSYNEGVTLVWPGMIPDFVLPAALTRIEAEAFADVPILTVSISDTVTAIDSTAFGDIEELYIFGKTGSTAEDFAQGKGYTFIPVA